MDQCGSLKKFLIEIPEILKHSMQFKKIRESFTRCESRVQSKPGSLLPSPQARGNGNTKSFFAIRSWKSKRNITKVKNNASLSPLTQAQKIRGGLM